MMAMILNELLLILCLVLLFMTKSALLAALRRDDQRHARVLLILRLGLALSAMTYLLRILAPTSDIAHLAGFLCTFAGSVLIWIGALEHRNLLRQRLSEHTESPTGETDDGSASPPVPGLPRLNSLAQRTLQRASGEARRRRQGSVDTDHMLLGLLQEPHSASADILGRLDIRPDNILLALGGASASAEALERPPSVETLPLTDRAKQALSLAAQEAHRFEKKSVGTDHLLLGLLLMGIGAAAASLFQEGITVENVRREVLKGQGTR